jgi:hypothetical protein
MLPFYACPSSPAIAPHGKYVRTVHIYLVLYIYLGQD